MAGAEPITIASEVLQVECAPAQGFVITSIRDGISGAEAIWMRRAHAPAECSRRLGRAGEASIETFLDVWPGGWFEMFPAVGYPLKDDPTSFLHGELVRLPWEVTQCSRTFVEAAVKTIRGPFLVTRALEVAGTELVIAERIEHIGGERAAYLWGHHPCFARATFAGGRIELVASRAAVPSPHLDPAAALLKPIAAFTWPSGPARDGGTIDASFVPPDADGRVDHICLTLDAGHVRLTAPLHGRALSITFDLMHFPYVLIWENFRARGGWPFWYDADTFAVEWSSNPGRSVADAKAADAVRALEPGEALETTIRLEWEPIETEDKPGSARRLGYDAGQSDGIDDRRSN